MYYNFRMHNVYTIQGSKIFLVFVVNTIFLLFQVVR
jgi:hypothetical protein